MKEIKPASLVKYFNTCKEHRDIKRKLGQYNFSENVEMITAVLQATDFVDGVQIYKEDIKNYIVEDNFLIGLDVFEDINLDEYKYLFDAFDVYFYSDEKKEYVQDKTLTKVWRNAMKITYANSTYADDLRLKLEQERKQAHTKIDENIDNQLEDLLTYRD